MKRAYIIICLAMFLTGCATKREVQRVIVERHDTLRLTDWRTDSVIVHDSVAVMMHGDTIRETRWRTEYRDRWRDKVRDVVRVVHDTTCVTKTVEVREPLIKRIKVDLVIACVFGIVVTFLRLVFKVINGRGAS